MWRKFLHDLNGVSLFNEKDFTTNFDMKLFSDASLIGFSAIFGSKWFCSAWPNQLPLSLTVICPWLSWSSTPLLQLLLCVENIGRQNVSYSCVTINLKS